MRRISLLFLIAWVLVMVGCGGSSVQQAPAPAQAPAAAEPATDLVTRALEISAAIEADPDSAEAILQSHDLTIEQFEEMLYEISADPELSKEFDAALAE